MHPNITQRNLASVPTLIAVLSSKIDGSATCLRWLQKCMPTVLLVDYLKQFLETQSRTLFTHSCINLCACGRNFARIQRAKSTTNNHASKPFKSDLTVLLILRLKRIGDKILPWGTPISCSYVSDRVEPALTWNSRWDRNPSTKVGKWPRKSIS